MELIKTQHESIRPGQSDRFSFAFTDNHSSVVTVYPYTNELGYLHEAKINWSAIGSVDAETTRAFARALLEAADIADKINTEWREAEAEANAAVDRYEEEKVTNAQMTSQEVWK